MIKRPILTLASAFVAVFGLLLVLSQAVAVSGEGIGNMRFSVLERPLLQGGTETEPNDTIAQANPIDVNLTMGGRIPITRTNDIDWFRLTLPAADIGRDFRATLEEVLPDADYRLELNLYDAGGSLIDTVSAGSSMDIDWTSTAVTYFLRVRADEFDIVNAPGDLEYELTVLRFAAEPTDTPTATPVPWDDCEINDNIDGAWPPGPCLLSVGLKKESLNFIPEEGRRPAPNDDYFEFLAKAGRVYRISTEVSGGADTEMWLYDPSNVQIDYDDDGGVGAGSRIERTLGDGFYKILVRDRLRSTDPPTSQVYNILVEDLTPATSTPTSTPGVGTVTATPTPARIPGSPDAFEPNYDFSRASLVGLDVKYANLNFVPWTGQGVDNDFYKLWVTGGKLYTCETVDLGDATNTNMILYSCPSTECGFSGNDDVQPFDPNDPYRSRITFFSSYTGYLYVLLGQVGADRILPSEWASLSYSLRCYIEQPGTATPTPTSAFVPPPTQPPSTPQPTSVPGQATPIPSPTPLVLVVIPMTTPAPPPAPPPAVTPTPQLYVVDVTLYYDRNGNGQMDPGEGIIDVLTRVYDAITGELLGVDYTDETGFLRFTVPSKRPVRISVPYFGFDQIVTTTSASIQIRIAPQP